VRMGLIPGDGVGIEVMAEVRKVLEATGLSVDLTEYDLGGARYLSTGEVLPDTVFHELSQCDAVLLGAVGHPDVPPGVLERGILLRLRFELDLAVNLRPVKLFPGVETVLAGQTSQTIDFRVVRENTEGLYVGSGGTIRTGSPDEIALQESINTRLGVERCIRFGFETACAHGENPELMLVHKTNVLTHAGGLWQRVFDEVAAEYPNVGVSYGHVDAVCLWMVADPGRFHTIVTDNLFGDIITDLGAGIAGGLGYAASGNLSLQPGVPSVFEPVHGSAPDIAGQGKANPVAAILSLWMALTELAETEAADRVLRAVETVAPDTVKVGTALSTSEVGDMIAGVI